MAHVLVVDDYDALRLLYGKILSQVGHKVYLAENGEQALRLYLRYPIDVVLTDIQMPRGGGIELIEAIRGLYPDASIVVVSGQGPAQMELAREAGARIVLAKPVDRESLIRAVDEAMNPRPEEHP